MKTIKSDPLFELINSLSSAEKRYFRKNIDQDNNYGKLFNGIDGLSGNYKHKALKDKIASESFSNHLAVAKSQLYNVVLDNLFGFYAESSVENQIKKKLNHIEILAKKGLYHQALKLTKKASDEIVKYELYNLMPILIDWQKYFTTYFGLDERDKINADIYVKELRCFEMIKCNAEYYRLYSELYSFTTRNRAIRSESNENYLNLFMDNVYIKDYNNALTFKSKIYYYRIHLLFERLQKNFKGGLELTKSILNLYNQNPLMIIKNKKNFLDENLNYLIYCMNTKNTSEFYKHLPLFRNIPEKYKFKLGEAEKNIIFESYIVEMAFNHFLGNYLKVIDAIPHIEKYLSENKLKLRYPQQSNLYSNAASAFFLLGKYNECLIWCSKFLNDKTLDSQFDLRVRILFMSIISNYELKYFDKMDSMILSAERYLNKIKAPMSYEKELLIYFRQSSRNTTKYELTYALEVLNLKIKKLIKDPLIAESLKNFEPAIWMDKKLSAVISL